MTEAGGTKLVRPNLASRTAEDKTSFKFQLFLGSKWIRSSWTIHDRWYVGQLVSCSAPQLTLCWPAMAWFGTAVNPNELGYFTIQGFLITTYCAQSAYSCIVSCIMMTDSGPDDSDNSSLTYLPWGKQPASGLSIWFPQRPLNHDALDPSDIYCMGPRSLLWSCFMSVRRLMPSTLISSSVSTSFWSHW